MIKRYLFLTPVTVVETPTEDSLGRWVRYEDHKKMFEEWAQDKQDLIDSLDKAENDLQKACSSQTQTAFKLKIILRAYYNVINEFAGASFN